VLSVPSLVHVSTCVTLMSSCRHLESHAHPDTIVQDHRFVIFEDYGCQAAVYNSLPALIIVWSPPLCICVIGIVYCGELIRYYCVHPSD
jgi:Pheromone A receptor